MRVRFLGIEGSARYLLGLPLWAVGEIRTISDTCAQAEGYPDAAAFVAHLKDAFPGVIEVVREKPAKPAPSTPDAPAKESTK